MRSLIARLGRRAYYSVRGGVNGLRSSKPLPARGAEPLKIPTLRDMSKWEDDGSDFGRCDMAAMSTDFNEALNALRARLGAHGAFGVGHLHRRGRKLSRQRFHGRHFCQ